MKSHRIIYFLFLLPAFVTILFAENNSDQIFKSLEGTWAAESWCNSIIENQSAKEAFKTIKNYMSHVFFKRAEKSYVADIIFNCFHEGSGDIPFREIREIDNNGITSYQLILGDKDSDINYIIVVATLQFIRSDKIKIDSNFMMGNPKTEYFLKLKTSLESFVNQNILSGTYKDNSGKKYVFHKNNKINWAGEELYYEILLDYVMFDNIDTFSTFKSTTTDKNRERKGYAFVKIKKNISFYHLNMDHEIVEPAYLILKYIKE